VKKVSPTLNLVRIQEKMFLKDSIRFRYMELYNAKEVASILRTKNFIPLTEDLLQLGIFNKTHYFKKKNDKTEQGIWTEEGVSILSSFFLVTKEEEEKYISLYYYLSNAIGEANMIGIVTERYNKLKLAENGKEKNRNAVKNYMTSNWSSFESKKKSEFDKYLFLMEELKERIERGEELYVYSKEIKAMEKVEILKSVKYEDFVA